MRCNRLLDHIVYRRWVDECVRACVCLRVCPFWNYAIYILQMLMLCVFTLIFRTVSTTGSSYELEMADKLRRCRSNVLRSYERCVRKCPGGDMNGFNKRTCKKSMNKATTRCLKLYTIRTKRSWQVCAAIAHRSTMLVTVSWRRLEKSYQTETWIFKKEIWRSHISFVHYHHEFHQKAGFNT